MYKTIWDIRDCILGRDDYYCEPKGLDEFADACRKMDAISEQSVIDLKDYYTILFIDKIDDVGIRFCKYLPAGDTTKSESFYVTREELAIEGVSYLAKEYASDNMRTAFMNESNGEIIFLTNEIKRSGDRCIGLKLSGPDSRVKAMYQAQQLKEAIEDVKEGSKVGRFVGVKRKLGRTKRFSKLLTCYAVKDVKPRNPWTLISDFLRLLEEYHPEYGSIHIIDTLVTQTSAKVTVEFANDIDAFYDRYEDAAATPCYILTISDCGEVPTAVRPAWNLGPHIVSSFNDEVVLPNEGYLRALKDARDKMQMYIETHFARRLDYHIYHADNCTDDFNIKELKNCKRIIKVGTVADESVKEFRSEFENMSTKMMTEEHLRTLFARVVANNMRHTTEVRQSMEQCHGLGIIYTGVIE